MAELDDILGDTSLQGKPLPLSAALPLLDIVAGRCAALYSKGSVVTGCFDDLSLQASIRHGDVVNARAEVVAVGSSSMVVSVVLYRQVFRKRCRDREVAIRCFATFIAMNDGKAPKDSRKILPALEKDVTSEMRHTLIENKLLIPSFKRWRLLMSTSDSDLLLNSIHKDIGRVHDVPTLYEQTFTEQVDVDETILKIRKQFLPLNLNMAGVVFGGDILATFETAATACANRFSYGSIQYRTVGMRSLSFLKPVPLLKVLEITCKVIASSTHFLSVLVRAYIHENETDEKSLSHHGIFYVMALDDDGESPAENNVGLRSIVDHSDANKDDFHRAFALPMSAKLKEAWGLTEDPYPS